jgi:hypothetical protein
MTIEDLLEDGWNEYKNLSGANRSFYKEFNTKTKCNCNSDKDGIQIELLYYVFPEHKSWQVKIIAELNDGVWVELMPYGLTLDEALAQIPRLIATWEFIANWSES